MQAALQVREKEDRHQQQKIRGFLQPVEDIQAARAAAAAAEHARRAQDASDAAERYARGSNSSAAPVSPVAPLVMSMSRAGHAGHRSREIGVRQHPCDRQQWRALLGGTTLFLLMWVVLAP